MKMRNFECHSLRLRDLFPPSRIFSARRVSADDLADEELVALPIQTISEARSIRYTTRSFPSPIETIKHALKAQPTATG